MTFVSPHLDDAVFSCGRAIAANPGATIATVLAAAPSQEQPLTEWDRAAGFATSRASVLSRQAEDARACEVLGARQALLRGLDGQYVRPANHESLIAADLARVLDGAAGATFLPLGIGHDDHILVARVARSVARTLGLDVVFYEEIPYRVIGDELAIRRAYQAIAVEGWLVEAYPSPESEPGIKEAAIDCYASQLGMFPRDVLLESERYVRARLA